MKTVQRAEGMGYPMGLEAAEGAEEKAEPMEGAPRAASVLARPTAAPRPSPPPP